jgi:hypothetical protein
MLNTIEGSFAIGAGIGIVIGLTVGQTRIGCMILLVVPVLMFGYVYHWQNQHLESLRSTSALDFIFGPLWPSSGAFSGYVLGKVIKAAVRGRLK